nr:hypothetical protein GCM10020092_052270 [Actinoplanes digitatis]
MRIRAASIRSPRFAGRTTPAWANSASTVAAGAAAAAVCEAAGPLSRVGASALDRQDRLAAGEGPDGTGELAGVAE